MKKMKKLIVNFDASVVNEAITAKIILEHNVLVNILRANVQEEGGVFLLEVPDDQCEIIWRAYENAGVKVEPGKVIEKLADKCINCGACFSICPVGAIEITPEDIIEFNYEKCIGCLNCVETCPVRAIIVQK
ncbi:MAG: 4Fe-4S dicluster domain-containing protein [Promethearchaeota archaeon]|nr:MAG: 4Fe-4S dicluster domain-containing protein [Candidatus Lokiarchaeota archaeon]